jgi:hypothetical protein
MKKDAMVGEGDDSASRLIDARISELNDWRGETLARVRALIHQADPDVVEEWKWRGVPVWSHAGILCTGETYKQVVKMTLPADQSLPATPLIVPYAPRGNAARDAPRSKGACGSRSRAAGELPLGLLSGEERAVYLGFYCGS